MNETTLITLSFILFYCLLIIIGLFVLINRLVKNNSKNEHHIIHSLNDINTYLQDKYDELERKKQLEKAK